MPNHERENSAVLVLHHLYLRLPYKVQKVDISKNEQKQPDFLAINPNGRLVHAYETTGSN